VSVIWFGNPNRCIYLSIYVYIRIFIYLCIYHKYKFVFYNAIGDFPNLEFVGYMVQTLNLILLTAPELFELRNVLKNCFNAKKKGTYVYIYLSLYIYICMYLFFYISYG
jgi:hypothetical protein